MCSSLPGTVGIPRTRKPWRKMCSNRRRWNRPMAKAAGDASLTTVCKLLCGPSVETHPIGSKRVRSGLLILPENAPEVRNKGSLTKIDAALPGTCSLSNALQKIPKPPMSPPMNRAQGNHVSGPLGRGEIQSGQRGCRAVKLSPFSPCRMVADNTDPRHRRKFR